MNDDIRSNILLLSKAVISLTVIVREQTQIIRCISEQLSATGQQKIAKLLQEISNKMTNDDEAIDDPTAFFKTAKQKV